LDNDLPPGGISVRGSGGTTYEANANFFSFYVRLNAQPTANVSIPVTVGDSTEGQLRSATGGPSASVTLIFSAANWNAEQYVNVYGRDDNECDGDITYGISVGPATSADSRYNGLSGAGVTATNVDDGQDCGSDISRFNGGYSGSYSGDAAGPVAFTVNEGSLTVSAPFPGSGTVYNDGQVAFGVVTSDGGPCSFSGNLVTTSGGGVSGSGTWVCTQVPIFGTASGSWTATRVSTLLASVLPLLGLQAESLSEADLQRLAGAAWADWLAVPGAAATIPSMPQIGMADLPGNVLGMVAGERVYLDLDGAGYGWFLDETPEDSTEFDLIDASISDSISEFQAREDGPAAGRFDLLTVLRHELGHVLGKSDGESDELLGDIMAATLAPGARRVLGPEAVDEVMGGEW
jgi:predicted outer membrane repeat protein